MTNYNLGDIILIGFPHTDLQHTSKMKKISDIPKSDRPREKLQQKGAEALSDTELLAILLGSGTKGHDVMAVAERILKVLDAHNEKLNIDELKKIEGVGPAKATLIAAALEFVRRRIRPEGLKISFPAYMYVMVFAAYTFLIKIN
jgi:DNA repair protein RadC